MSTLYSKEYGYGVLKVSKGAWIVLRGRRKSRLYVLEGLTVIVDAATAYGLIIDDSSRVGCDWIVFGDSNNNIGKFPSSSGEVSSDLIDILLVVI